MRSFITVASLLFLATGSFAQYGSGYGSGSGSGSSDDNSGTPVSSVDDNSGTPVSSVNRNNEKPTSTVSPVSAIPSASSAPVPDSSTPAGEIEVHVVKVSNKAGDLTFEPNNLEAKPGSMVQFHFYPKKHSVVQSTFDQPCIPIHNVNKSVTGFFSGFMPVEKGATMLPTYTIMVNDTKPIWYYCSQSDHCQEGMVGVINAPAKNKSRTITTFAELAGKATENVTPSIDAGAGGSSGKDSGSPSQGSSASSSSIPVSLISSSPTSLAGTGTGTIIKATSTSSTNASAAAFTGAANTLAGKQGMLGGAGLAGMIGLVAAFAL